jgi:hypothetical protein
MAWRGRFSGDAISWPLWLRVGVTLPLVLVGYVLLRMLYLAASANAPAAALALLLVGIFLVYSLPFLRSVWRSNKAWRYAATRREAESRHLGLMIERRGPEPPTDDHEGGPPGGAARG